MLAKNLQRMKTKFGRWPPVIMYTSCLIHDGLESASFRFIRRSFDLSLYHIKAKLALRQTTTSLQGLRQRKKICGYTRGRDKQHDLAEVPVRTQTHNKSGFPRATDTLEGVGKRKNTRGPARATRGALSALSMKKVERPRVGRGGR
jgi:hypothetical protein